MLWVLLACLAIVFVPALARGVVEGAREVAPEASASLPVWRRGWAHLWGSGPLEMPDFRDMMWLVVILAGLLLLLGIGVAVVGHLLGRSWELGALLGAAPVTILWGAVGVRSRRSWKCGGVGLLRWGRSRGRG